MFIALGLMLVAAVFIASRSRVDSHRRLGVVALARPTVLPSFCRGYFVRYRSAVTAALIGGAAKPGTAIGAGAI